MKEYLYLKKHEIPLYKSEFGIIFTNSVIKLKEIINGYDSDDIYGHAVESNFEDKQAFLMILNFHYPGFPMTHGSIAHEVLHVVRYIANSKGFSYDFNNDEPIAYLAGWLTDKTYEFIAERRFKISLEV